MLTGIVGLQVTFFIRSLNIPQFDWLDVCWTLNRSFTSFEGFSTNEVDESWSLYIWFNNIVNKMQFLIFLVWLPLPGTAWVCWEIRNAGENNQLDKLYLPFLRSPDTVQLYSSKNVWYKCFRNAFVVFFKAGEWDLFLIAAFYLIRKCW